MGLFSKFTGNARSENLSPQESFMGLVISLIAADGHVSQEEINDANSVANKSKLLKGMSNRDFTNLVNKLVRILEREGIEKLVNLSIEGLPNEYNESVFAVLCDLAFSDGYIEKEEEGLLEYLREKLAVSEELAAKIVEVISLKNKI